MHLTSIEWDCGTLTAGTMVGLTIKTDTGEVGHVARVELNSADGLKCIDSAGAMQLQLPTSGNEIRIRAMASDPAIINFKADDGTLRASIFANNEILYLSSEYDLWHMAVNSIDLRVNAASVLKLRDAQIGFFGSAGTTKPTITGTRDGNAALADFLTKTASLGLLVDSTTAGNSPFDAGNLSSGTLSTDRYSAIADLTAESKIGAAAGQVAAGDHTHAIYGDVWGPASSVANEIAIFSDVSGEVIEGSGFTISTGFIRGLDGIANAYSGDIYGSVALNQGSTFGETYLEGHFSSTKHADVDVYANTTNQTIDLSANGSALISCGVYSGVAKMGFFGAAAIAQPALAASPTAAEISTVLHDLGLVS